VYQGKKRPENLIPKYLISGSFHQHVLNPKKQYKFANKSANTRTCSASNEFTTLNLHQQRTQTQPKQPSQHAHPRHQQS
jgi:hypothetical protein